MELRQLQYFLAVVQEENISRAADAIHVTQPTLSRQMAQLEEELGTPLFVRGRHLELTEAGISLRRRAEEVVSLINKIEDDFTQQKDLEGVISIGTGRLNSSKILPGIMAGFRRIHPKVQFQIYTNSGDQIKERLEQGLLDFGFLLGPADVTKWDYLRMKDRERWGLLLRKDHPLAQKEVITKEDLIGESIITSDRVSVQKELNSWLGDVRDELDVFATYNVVVNVTMLVESGIALLLAIEGAVNRVAAEGLVFRPLYPELSMTSVFVWKKNLGSFGAASAFLSYFKSML